MRLTLHFENDTENLTITIKSSGLTPMTRKALNDALGLMHDKIETIKPGLVIESTGLEKIALIKAIRTIYGLPLKEAKDLAETSVPIKLTYPPTMSLDDAARMLTDAGAKVAHT